jgi:alcohol dehydrogenase
MVDEARAAVFSGPGLPLQIRSLPLPNLGPGEALVRVRLTTICGSDLHTHDGRREAPCPTILGHEIVGTIAALSADDPPLDTMGHPLTPGDRVTWSMMANCGDCFFCHRELPQKCQHLFKYGHEPLRPERPLAGGLATHCHLVRGTRLFQIPEGLPDAIVCPANCATATVAAALRHAGPMEEAVVLIHGAGLLGLTAAAWARVRGARAVVVCETSRERLAVARRFGATHTAAAAGDVLRRLVVDLTEGRGADVALEMSGSPDAAAVGIDSLRPGGRAVWIGAVFPTRIAQFSIERVVRHCLTVQGVHNYHPRDLAGALDFLAVHHSHYPFAEVVGATFSLEAVEEAFQRAQERTCLRVAVAP